MNEPALSVSTVLWDGYPFATALEDASAAGIAYVEPAFIDGYVTFDETDLETPAATHLVRRIESAGLAVHAVSAHMNLAMRDAEPRLERRIRFAEALGARCLVTNAGPAVDATLVLGRLERVVPQLERAGVVLALENPGHGAGDMLPDGRSGLRLLDRLGRPEWIRLNYDIGNAWSYHHGAIDLADDLAAAMSAMAFVHLKDVATEGDGWRFVAPGEGEVGLLDLVSTLRARRPDLVLGLEMPLRLQRPGRGDPIRRTEPIERSMLVSALRRAVARFA